MTASKAHIIEEDLFINNYSNKFPYNHFFRLTNDLRFYLKHSSFLDKFGICKCEDISVSDYGFLNSFTLNDIDFTVNLYNENKILISFSTDEKKNELESLFYSLQQEKKEWNIDIGYILSNDRKFYCIFIILSEEEFKYIVPKYKTKIEKEDLLKCKAITKKGIRCTRSKTSDNFCTQHSKIMNNTLEQKKE